MAINNRFKNEEKKRESFDKFNDIEDAKAPEVKRINQEENDKKSLFYKPITRGQKLLRMFLGGFLIAAIIYSGIATSSPNVDRTVVEKGYSTNVKVGSIVNSNQLSGLSVKSQDYQVTNADDGSGSVELAVWDFKGEGTDYVQVFVDGVPKTNPFLISKKVVKVKVPSKATIQVRGISDGNNNGITYALTFSKTGETFFNLVPVNASNTYTIKTSY